MICTVCGKTMDEGSRFCSQCGATMQFRTTPRQEGPLVRPLAGRMIAGVCAAFAQRYGWDVTIVRIVLAVVALCGVGCPVLAYLVAWVIIPNERYPMAGTIPVAQTPPQTGTTIS